MILKQILKTATEAASKMSPEEKLEVRKRLVNSLDPQAKKLFLEKHPDVLKLS